MSLTKEDIYQEAIEQFGVTPQIDMAIEEMSELTKALCKFKRGNRDLVPIIDELADVEIMVDQMKQLFCVKEQVKERKQLKIARLAQMLGGF